MCWGKQGFTAATNAARHELFGLSRAVMSAAEGYLGMSGGALESLLDDGTRLSDGQWSSTQHRLCLYHADTNVPFEAHTDTTFLTLIPCSSIAGLEVWTEKNGWVRPEEHKESGGSVVVMPGEFLQVFTAGFFSAAVHRVTRFSSTALASEGKRVTRLSAPLLVRGVKETVIDPSAFLDANEAADKRIRKVGDVMKRLEGVTLYDLHSCLVQPPNLDSL